MTLRLLKTVVEPGGDSAVQPVLQPTGSPVLQYHKIHGHTQAFIYTGQGPVLVLIHGVGDSSDTWKEVLSELSQRYTVIAPDLFGHGRSDKPHTCYSISSLANSVRDLLDVLGVYSATVIGHSLGGGVSMQFAYQFPTRCERLVLVASGGVCAEVSRLLRLASMPASELVLPVVASRPVRKVAQVALKLAKRLGADIGVDAEDLMRVMESLPDRRTRKAFLRTLRSVVDVKGQSVTMLDRVYLAGGYPILVVWGARDSVIPARHAEIVRLALPTSRVEVFEKSGHFPHNSEPQRFVRVLEDFIKETEPAVHDPEAWRGRLIVGPRDRRLLVDLSTVKCPRAATCGAWCADLPKCESSDLLKSQQQNDV